MVEALEAPCGIHCGICVLHKAMTDTKLQRIISKRIQIPPDKVVCPGCREINGFCPVISEQCATWVCTAEKNVSFCSECTNFPCLKLLPCSDRAEELPQNIKIFSLTLRKTKGEEVWKRSIKEIYELYFKGNMVIGHGPQKPSDGDRLGSTSNEAEQR